MINSLFRFNTARQFRMPDGPAASVLLGFDKYRFGKERTSQVHFRVISDLNGNAQQMDTGSSCDGVLCDSFYLPSMLF